MILFSTNTYQWNLSHLPITFNEVSNYFEDGITKSYSYPFNVEIDADVIEKLNLINVNNIVHYNAKIEGTLTLDRRIYPAKIIINQITTDKAELTLFFGKEALEVFDKKLSQLPFETTTATGGLPAFAKLQIEKEWPEATHNFVKMYRNEIAKDSNYRYFENFVNNYVFDDPNWGFPENSVDVIESVSTVVNRNVMAPFTYLLEVLKVGFKTEGLELRGEFAEDDFIKKVLLVPQNFFEQNSVTEFLDYSFSNFTSQELLEEISFDRTINVYSQTHTPDAEGSYTLDMRINMSSFVAQYFLLTVKRGATTLFRAFSENTEVFINQTLDITVDATTVDVDIVVELRLAYQTQSIAPYNNFSYQYKEGQLNVFPDTYNIANFLPDITFKELFNKIKNLFNIDYDYTESAVYIYYLENELERLTFKNLSENEDPNPKRILNTNNLFKLKLPDGQELLVNANGQTYSAKGYTKEEIEEIKIEALPLKVVDNDGSVTAVYPKKEEEVMLCLYDGLVDDQPLAQYKIENRGLILQDVYDLHYKKWLTFRANSETYKDEFLLPVTEILNIKEGIYRYNKHHLIKSLSKQRINEDYWNIEMETEAL